MLWKKTVNTFILYSVNYIVDKLNDSHYGCLWPGKEDRREEKDSFRLVMYFKHTFTCLNNNNGNNKGTACKHPKLPEVHPLDSSGHFHPSGFLEEGKQQQIRGQSS